MRFLRNAFLLFLLSSAAQAEAPAAKPPRVVPGNRVASIYVAQTMINELIAAHSKSEIVRHLTVSMDSDNDLVVFRGTVHVPVEEMRAINLDPKLGEYRFRVAVKLETTPEGHLILEFPLAQTYFYPAGSRDERERVVVPVQLLSVALASVRGYLAALSGDFRGFDRRTAKLQALVRSMDRAIAREKNADAREDLRNQREALRLQLASVPIERKQLQSLSKELGSMLGFTGEKELSLNEGLAARKNALILKVSLSQLAPFLKGVELGGVRLLHDKKDGNGEYYLALDVNASMADGQRPPDRIIPRAQRPGAPIAPSLMLRLHQSIFESEAVKSAQQQKLPGKLREFHLALKDDGLHVAGRWRAFLFTVPFDTVIDLVSTGTDVFEARVRDVAVAGIDLQFLSKYALESVKKRLDESLKGICTFTLKEGPALEVHVDAARLAPAFPFLHLISVDVREQEFVLKLGRVS